MRDYYQIVNELEKAVKDNPEAARLVDELVKVIGQFETELMQAHMDLNQRSWDGYVDAQSGAFSDREIADHLRGGWT